MIVYYIGLYLKNEKTSILIKDDYNLSSITYFCKSSVKEFILFIIKLIISKDIIEKTTITEKDYKISIDPRKNNVIGLIITDFEYPVNVAFDILNKVIFDPKILHDIIIKCQDPRDISKIYKVNEELDKTIDTVQKTISDILDRGAKLENLIKQSNELSDQSKLFYEKASNANKCCIIS